MTSKIKMAAIVGGLCMEGLWRGWRFAMIGIKKSEWLFVRARTNSFWAIRTAITHVILSYNSVLKYTNLRRVLWSRD